MKRVGLFYYKILGNLNICDIDPRSSRSRKIINNDPYSTIMIITLWNVIISGCGPWTDETGVYQEKKLTSETIVCYERSPYLLSIIILIITMIFWEYNIITGPLVYVLIR